VLLPVCLGPKRKKDAFSGNFNHLFIILQHCITFLHHCKQDKYPTSLLVFPGFSAIFWTDGTQRCYEDVYSKINGYLPLFKSLSKRF